MTEVRRGRTALLLLALAASWMADSNVDAQNHNTYDSSLSEVFAKPGASSSAGFVETVDAFHGSARVNLTLLSLRGKAGLDLVVAANYDSHITVDLSSSSSTSGTFTDADPMSGLGGAGWSLHFGHLFNPDGLGSYIDPNVTEGDGETHNGPDIAVRDNPWFVDPSGARHVFYNLSTSSYSGDMISPDRWVFEKVTSSQYRVTDPSGIAYTFSSSTSNSKYTDYDGNTVLATTQISNPAGASISISYNSGGKLYRVTDSWSRTLSFTYNSTYRGYSQIELKDPDGNLIETHKFTYSGSLGTFAVGGSETTTSRTVYAIKTYTPPVGPPTKFSYTSSRLSKITNRYGGTVEYTYGTQSFAAGGVSDGTLYVVKTRKLKDRGGSSERSYSYTYSYSSTEGQKTIIRGPEYYTETIVFDQMGGTFQRLEPEYYPTGYYVLGGVAGTSTDSAYWPIGRINSRTTQQDDSSGKALWKTKVAYQYNDWSSTAIVSDDVLFITYGEEPGYIEYVQAVVASSETREEWVYDSDGSSMKYKTYTSFDTNGNPSYATEYDASGTIKNKTRFTYFTKSSLNLWSGLLLTQSPDSTYGHGDSISNTYDDSTALLLSHSVNGVGVSYSYYSGGNLASRTDARGNVTTYADWSYQIPTTITTPLSTIVSTVSVKGELLTTNNGSSASSFAYDALGRLTRSIDGDSSSETTSVTRSFEYGIENDVETYFLSKLGDAWEKNYVNGFGEVRKTEDLNGNQTIFERDLLGVVRKETHQIQRVMDEPDGPVETFAGDIKEYDARGRITKITHADNTTRAFSYSEANASVTERDEVNQSVTTYSQVFGSAGNRRVIRTDEPSAKDDGTRTRTCFFYEDTTGQRSGKVAFMDRASTSCSGGSYSSRTLAAGDRLYTYESHHWLASVQSKEEGTITNEYDAVGNRTRTTNAEHVLEYEFDELNRVLSIKENQDDVLWVILGTFTYDTSGNVTYAEKGSAHVAREWDLAGRLISDKTYEESGYWDTLYFRMGVTYEYDPDFPLELSGYILSNNDEPRLEDIHIDREDVGTYYRYDAGRPYRIWAYAGDVAGSTNDHIEYHASGRVANIPFGNGVAETTRFDSRWRPATRGIAPGLTALTDANACEANCLDYRSYSYNSNSALKAESFSAYYSGATTSLSKTYTYTARGQLKQSTLPSGATTYSYDDLLNVKTEATPTSTTTYNYDDNNRLASLTDGSATTVTFTHDAVGSELSRTDTSGFSRSIGYDEFGRPETLYFGSSKFVFDYDALGRRYAIREYKKNSYGRYVLMNEDHYLHGADGTIIAKMSDYFELIEAYVWLEGRVVASIKPDFTIETVHSDRMRSPLFILDDDGNVVWQKEYDAYGEGVSESGTTESRFDFAAYLNIPGSKLLLSEARLYDSSTGRFTSADPLDGASPAAWNRYAFGLCDPINWTDPDGRAPASESQLTVMRTLVAAGVSSNNISTTPPTAPNTAFFAASFPFNSKLMTQLGEIHAAPGYVDGAGKMVIKGLTGGAASPGGVPAGTWSNVQNQRFLQDPSTVYVTVPSASAADVEAIMKAMGSQPEYGTYTAANDCQMLTYRILSLAGADGKELFLGPLEKANMTLGTHANEGTWTAPYQAAQQAGVAAAQ